jgi:hypothetical protein
MTKSIKTIACIFGLISFLCPTGSVSQSDVDIETSVDNLVGRHYMDGIPYDAAHMLEPEALPYLFELLGDPNKKPFWVNIIVTIGFMENPSAVESLVAFLENARGEVDSFTFRALLSVPYALGCIAVNGDGRALQYLSGNLNTPLDQAARWSHRGKPVAKLIAEQSVMGLAVSGRPEARSLLLDLEAKMAQETGSEAYALGGDIINQAYAIMNRIATEGRAAVFNPKRED